MSKEALLSLGFTEKEIEDRLFDRLYDDLFHEKYFDESFDSYQCKDTLFSKFKKHFDTKTEGLLNEHIGKFFELGFEKIINEKFYLTNNYGEKKGDALTLREYIIAKVDKILKEPTDSSGRIKGERDFYASSSNKTFAEYLADSLILKEAKQTIKDIYSKLAKEIGVSLYDSSKLNINEVLGKIVKKMDDAIQKPNGY